MKTIDARGLPCPKPVMMAREAVRDGADALCVAVDNEVSASNVTRFLENEGFAVTREGSAEEILLRSIREKQAAPPAASREEAPAYLILSRTLGSEDLELGELLMKSFLGTVAAGKPLPRAVALMNGGVRLAMEDSSCSETLRELECEGVLILVCGTCAKHFGVMDRIVVGQISNMFEITSAVFEAEKPIVLG